MNFTGVFPICHDGPAGLSRMMTTATTAQAGA